MITGKQRAYLKKLAHDLEPQVLIGKAGITDNLIEQINQTLVKRELIKIKILNNNMQDRQELLDELIDRLQAEFVQEMGSRIVLYRKNPDENILQLPK
ncbi:MAG: ribosome assembly RNA-binding protein YhbY [Tissierellia bacterium]|nr:ribosome assembly RNA-binding protein YhbY [Tissierellia bacterium]